MSHMSRRPRISIIAPRKPSEGFGGAEQHLRDLGDVLRSIGADVGFLSRADAPEPGRIERLVERAFPLAGSPLASRRIARTGQLADADIVLSLELMGYVGVRARHLHLFFGSYAGFRRRALGHTSPARRLVRRGVNVVAKVLENGTQGSDGAIANSYGLRDELSAAGVRIRDEVIPPPTNVNLFAPRARDSARRALGLAPAAQLLLFAGRWEYAKGADRVERLLALLPPSWSLLLACPSLATWRWPRDPRIHSIRDVRRASMADVYSAADVLIQPSRFEGYSLVVSEAQACGCPVITSPVGHAYHLSAGPAAVRDGIVYEPDRPDSWMRALNRIAGSPERHANASRAARAFAEVTVAPRVIAHQWHDLLRTLYPEFAWHPPA
jgi:glycosyltransferase involved in cell wall biosynthesis